MTRILIDTRSHRDYRVVATMAGACDLDVVIFLAREFSNRKVAGAIKRDLKRTDGFSNAFVLEIPCHTVDAIAPVRYAIHSGDIIVTDSSPLALECLANEGAAIDSRGEEYTYDNIIEKVEEFYRCRALIEQGINPYVHHRYKKADYKRLRIKLEELIYTMCGATPRKDIDFRMPSHKLPPTCTSRTDMRVFVDGDGCPVVPEIIQACGEAHVPLAFVSNRHVDDLAREALRKNPSALDEMNYLPEITCETVPVEQDSADAFIEQAVSTADVVVTDDFALTASCLCKGAAVISSYGCVFDRVERGTLVTREDVAARSVRLVARKNQRSAHRAFRKSLRELLTAV